MTEPQKFRRRCDKVVEAIQYTAESCRACHEFLRIEHDDEGDCESGIVFGGRRAVVAAEVGDWIVCFDRRDGIFERFSDEDWREDWELLPEALDPARLAAAEAQAAEHELALVGLHQLLIEAREGKHDEAGFRLAVDVALEHAALVEAAGRDRLRREVCDTAERELELRDEYEAASTEPADDADSPALLAEQEAAVALVAADWRGATDRLRNALAALRAAEGTP